MSECDAVPDTSFYNRKPFGLLHEKTTPSTSSNNAWCWTSGFYSNNRECPTNWTYVTETNQGCGLGELRPVCKFDGYAKDNKTRARCCWGVHTTGRMNDFGQFPADQTPCPSGYCLSKQGESQCKQVIQDHCRTQFALGSEDNEKCWQWAKGQWSEGIDDYCKNWSTGNGIGIWSEPQCKAYVSETGSSGKLDNAVTAYCSSPAAKTNLALGDTTCLCFPGFSTVSDNVSVNQRALLVCNNQECFNKGYKTAPNKQILAEGCPDFCAQFVNIGSVQTSGGDISAIQNCKDTAMQAAGKIDAAHQQELNASQKISSTTRIPLLGNVSNTGIILLIIAAGLLLIVFFAFVLYVLNSADDEEYNVGRPRPFSNIQQIRPEIIQSEMQPGQFRVAQPEQLLALRQ